MTKSAIVFMVGSWGFVLGLTFWSFWRLLSSEKAEAAPEGAVERAEG
jgi:hypothetical protein